METFQLTTDHIQLNQLLKALGWCGNGGDANAAIENRQVKVNGEVELRKRNKIRAGFKVEFGGKTAMIK